MQTRVQAFFNLHRPTMAAAVAGPPTKVRYQMGLIGKLTILSSVALGEMTVLTWMIPDLTWW